MKQILTHPGGAHKDDFLACAVLLAQSPVSIERRNPTEAELEDPAVAVVDIGHRHEPERLNFDHHQFPREQAPTCALSLVLQHQELYDAAREFCDWLETSEWLDCRGPQGTSKWLGVEREVLAKLNSPIDVTLLRRFASQSTHRPGEPVWEIMRMIGEDLVAFITGLRERLTFIGQHAEIWDLRNFRALFMPRTESLPDEPSAGLGRYLEREGLGDEVIALVYPDRRGEGYGLRRFDDSAPLDFTRLESEADVHFTHPQGFIAKTGSTEPERLRTLLELAHRIETTR